MTRRPAQQMAGSDRSQAVAQRQHVLRRMRVCRAEADYGLRAEAQSAKAGVGGRAPEIPASAATIHPRKKASASATALRRTIGSAATGGYAIARAADGSFNAIIRDRAHP